MNDPFHDLSKQLMPGNRILGKEERNVEETSLRRNQKIFFLTPEEME